MEDISNKTLALLLVVAILTSVGGLTLSLNRINRLAWTPGITGQAISNGNGRINVSIGGVTSINVTDDYLNFGACSPVPASGSTFNSNYTNAVATPIDTYNCTMVAPDNLTIRNIGNTNVNLTASFATNGSFIGGLNPQLWFYSQNDTNAPGCGQVAGTAYDCTVSPSESNCSTTWGWFEITKNNYQANNKICLNLSASENRNSVIVYAKIFVPPDAPVATGLNTTVMFTGTGI
jgi:hypothetical protein